MSDDRAFAESCADGLRSLISEYDRCGCDAEIRIACAVIAQPGEAKELFRGTWHRITLDGVRVVGCNLWLDLDGISQMFSPKHVVLEVRPLPRGRHARMENDASEEEVDHSDRLEQVCKEGLAWDLEDRRQRALLHCTLVQAGMHPLEGQDTLDVVEARSSPEGLYVRFQITGDAYLLSSHLVLMRTGGPTKTRVVE